MNRLCIYMTYNKECRIYKYICQALKSIKECCFDLCLVCNYREVECDLEYIHSFTDYVFFRDNRGYDSGAYKDVLCNFIGWSQLSQYDELILVNDSFFCFFYPLQDTFDLMDQMECDFWGMTGQSSGEFSNPVYEFEAHIHSYFLVFKRRVVQSRAFRDFWENYSYPKNFREAIVNYEIGLNRCLKQQGFKGISYIDVYNCTLNKNENPCYSKPLKLIKDYKVPVMKKKCVLIRNSDFKEVLEVLTYLEKENLYPVDWIISYMENQFYIRGIGEKPNNSLEIFYKNHANLYIYGSGVCGKNLAIYFSYKGWNQQGFIVTNPVDTENVISLEDADINENTGIVVSLLNKEIASDIERHIGNRCKREQLFFISECEAIKLPE